MSQPSSIPTVPLRPAPAASEMTQSTYGTNRTIAPDAGSTVDWEDPKSVEVVTLIVEKVLRRLGCDGVTIVGNGRKKKFSNKRSRETAIKAQQALLSREEDCQWKVRDHVSWSVLY